MCFMQHDVLARAITWGGGGPKQISDVICMITIYIMSGINGQCYSITFIVFINNKMQCFKWSLKI